MSAKPTPFDSSEDTLPFAQMVRRENALTGGATLT